MTYIDRLNYFYRWQKTNHMSGNARLLYYEILGLFNEAGWPESIQLDNYRLMWMVDTRTERVAIAARDKLVELGFIEYKKGRKGSPNKYSLTKYTLQKVSESDSVSVSENDSESDSVSVSEKCSHIKTLDLDLEKDTLPPKSPQGESERFRAFWEAYPRQINFGKAQRAWEKLGPDTKLAGIILSAVQEQIGSAQWQQEGGRFIPSPDNWLTNRCWEDKLAPAKPGEKPSYDIDELEELSHLRVPDKL